MNKRNKKISVSSLFAKRTFESWAGEIHDKSDNKGWNSVIYCDKENKYDNRTVRQKSFG